MDAVSMGKRMRLILRVFSEVPEIARVAYQLFSGQHLQFVDVLYPGRIEICRC